MYKRKITINKFGLSSKYLSIHRFIKNEKVDKAKSRKFPSLRGTILPSFDPQYDVGIAINWFYVRIRISLELTDGKLHHWWNKQFLKI